MSGYAGDTDWSGGIMEGTTQQADPTAAGVAGSSGLMLGTGTGQAGVQLLDASGASNGNPFVAAWSFLNKPFKTPMTMTGVFLLVGTVIVAIVLWNLILYHIRIAAEEI
jgi:hypothetical protein